MSGILREAPSSESSEMVDWEGVAISAGEERTRRPTGGFSRRRELPRLEGRTDGVLPGGRKKRIGAGEGSRAGTTTAKGRKRKG